MIHSQEELNQLWMKLKGQKSSVYDTESITVDSDLEQGLQIDVVDPVGGPSKSIPYTRRRNNLDDEWGPWEEGFSASI